MRKIKDNISNHSKTSREFSSLCSSSNESESEKYQKTLQNFSESYIRQLSKKIKEKTSQSVRTPLGKDEKEIKAANEKNQYNSSNFSLKKIKSDPAPFNENKNNISQSDKIDVEKDEGNPLMNELLLASGDTTKKDPSQMELEGDLEDKKQDVSYFFSC